MSNFAISERHLREIWGTVESDWNFIDKHKSTQPSFSGVTVVVSLLPLVASFIRLLLPIDSSSGVGSV